MNSNIYNSISGNYTGMNSSSYGSSSDGYISMNSVAFNNTPVSSSDEISRALIIGTTREGAVCAYGGRGPRGHDSASSLVVTKRKENW